MKQILTVLVLISAYTAAFSQSQGYIYVHLRNVNEESTPSPGISFSLSGSSTPGVSSFTLNDQPDIVNYMYDIGASHGTSTTGGDGELWVVTKSGWGASGSGAIYRRKPNGAAWDNISQQGSAVDGAGVNQCVFVNNNNAYFYNAGTLTTIWTASSHSNINAVDIAYGGGQIAIITSDGSLYKNNATSSYTDSWTRLVNAASLQRLDILPSNLNIVTSNSSGSVTVYNNTGGTVTTAGNPTGGTNANYDVCFSDDGTVFAVNNGRNAYYYNGSSWTNDPSGQNLLYMTGGPVKQAWASTQWNYSYMQQAIYTRTNTGLSNSTTSTFTTSTTPVWIDDERVRTNYNDNSIMIPVTAGTYTLRETVPSGWDIQGIDCYDPTTNSTGNTTTNSVSINVSAGEVVHVVLRNEKLVPISMLKQCSSNQLVENFDTITSPMPVTSYHWSSTVRTDDGRYSVGTTSTGWPHGTLTDHTSGTGKYMMVNASFQPDEFYRKRMINLVQGAQYQISFWVINLSGGISPDIRYGINDSNGVVLQSISTGSIADDQVWHNYVLTFTATTGTADVFLQNNAAGGGGNDVGIDDIALSPLATPITAMSITPVPIPNLCIGTSYTFSVIPTGGTWASSVRTVASINPASGIVNARAAGTSVISYHYTNAIGCSTDTATQVNVSAPPTVVATLKYAGTIFKGGTVCKGSIDSLLSAPTGGTLPYTYRWSASPSNSAAGLGTTNIQNTIATPTNAGTYIDTITITDAAGCTAYDTTLMIVSNNTQPVITLGSTGTNCTSTTINLATTMTTNGTSPYTYSWVASPSSGSGLVNTTASSTTAVPTASGTYTFTANLVDNAKCMAQATRTVTVNTSPTISASYSPGGGVIVLCKNGTISLNSTPSGGTTPYTYLWSGAGSGKGVVNNTGTQNTTASPTNGTANYTVALTDSKGCTASASTGNITVTINPALNAPAVTASATLATPCVNTSATAIGLSGSATGGSTILPYTYQWTSSSGNTIASPTIASTTATAAATGNFTLTVTDNLGCVGSATTNTVTVNSLPVVTANSTFLALCSGQTTTALSAVASGGSGAGYGSWSWSSSPSNGGIVSTTSQNTNATPGTHSPTTTYTYSVTVKDGNGCTSLPGSVNVVSSTKTVPTTTISPTTGSKVCGTTISLGNTPGGGTTPYTYAWTGTGINDTTLKSPTATPGSSGTYTYSVVVRDANLCQVSASTSVTLNNPVTVSPVANNPSFCKGSTTSLTLFSNPAGGNGTYTYAWSGTPSGNGLAATSTKNTTAVPTGAIGSSYTYSVTVTDGNSCSATGSVSVINVVATPSISAVASASAYCINQPVTLTSTPSGGLAPYTYAWTAPTNATVTDATAQNTTATPGTANNYAFTVTVQDNNNCTASGTTGVVTINSLPTVSAIASSYSVCANPSQTITLTASPSGGSTPYASYQWTGSNLAAATTTSVTNTATPTAAGTYSVRVTDANGCISTAGSTPNVAIDQGQPSISLSCGTNSNGVKYGQFYESNGVSWTWTSISGGRFYTSSSLSLADDSDVSTSQAPYIVQKGTYKVSITNGAGCKGSDTYTVTATSCTQVLAANFLTFTATAQNSQALLVWTYVADKNVKSFAVERSGDGTTFTQIGTIDNDGKGQFAFTDAMPLTGTNYYRIKMIEADNGASYSAVRTVKFDASVWIVKLYPVPARSFINVDINNDKEEKAVIILHTTTGQQVLTQNIVLQKGFNHIVLNNLDNLAEGSYFITLQTVDRVYKNKFIKGKY